MKKLRNILIESENYEGGISPERFKRDLKSGNANYEDEVHEHGQHHLTGDISHIGPKEQTAIQRWTTPVYRSINDHMRNGGGDERTKTLASNLENAISNHSLPNSTWAYRGIHAIHSDNLKKLRPGDHFHSEGFSSTTLDPNRATHFAKGEDILAMHLPKGTKALYVSHPKLNSWTAEKEMTLAPKTHFKYIGSEDIEAPEHHYDGTPTGKKRKYKLHHVEVIPHTNESIAIDK